MQPFQNCNTQLTQCLTVCEMKYFSSAGINYFLFQPAPPAPGPSSEGVPVQDSPDRRCSTRLLSASVHQTLKQLQKEQYEQRVAQLVHRNKIFYRRQRICESFTAFLILVSFTGREINIIINCIIALFAVFSLYMVLSYGFNYFWTAQYNIISVSGSQNRKLGDTVSLVCQADDHWEWCRRVETLLSSSNNVFFSPTDH